MKIQLLSDLHLEVHPHYQPTPAAGADVLVLAGDIGSYQSGSLLAGDYFGLERFSPLPQFASWPCPVIFVPGNHEYDQQDWDAADARLRQRSGVQHSVSFCSGKNGARLGGCSLEIINRDIQRHDRSRSRRQQQRHECLN